MAPSGMPPARYWVPQLTRIWVPGLSAAALFAVLAWLAARAAPPRDAP